VIPLLDGPPAMLIVESILRYAPVPICKEDRRPRIKEFANDQ
jgi:hypothetical protein